MMTVLQSQHVRKRASSSVLLRARANGARWSNTQNHALVRFPVQKKTAAPGPEQGQPHSFLRGQLIGGNRRRFARALARRLRKDASWSRQQAAEKQQRAPRLRRIAKPAGVASEAARRVMTSPWLVIGLVAAASALFLAFSVDFSRLPLPQAKPVLPAPAEVDPALYSLLIPETAAVRAPMVNPVLLTSLKVSQYKAQPGDTLGKIASRFKLNVDTIVSWNDVRDARAIAAGTSFSIPNSNGLKYTVRRGDTLQGIARTRGVELNSILDWNRLSSSVISVGQDLFLPGARMNPDELSKVMGSLFIFPVQGRISSYFGQRPDPFTGVANYHNGIDIVNKPGTAIAAAMSGTVADVGFNNNYGNYVILKHSGGYQTLYGHMTRYVVSRGQKIQQGQEIGELGSTGYSTGPHVHFSVFRNGQPVDPLRFLK
jgi:murein DD-endopeptidase MepM/ murein hydrolase activator NlpD